MIDKNAHREGQVFWLKTRIKTHVFLIVGRTFHEESNQEVWLALELETGDESCFSEDFLRIKEKSARVA